MSAVLLLCFRGSAFALSWQDGKVSDGRYWWYPSLKVDPTFKPDPTNMNYTKQEEFIVELNNEAYGGVKHWRFAQDYEVTFLLNRFFRW